VRDALLEGGGWPAQWWKVLIIGFNRIGLLRHRLAQHAPHAVESVTG